MILLYYYIIRLLKGKRTETLNEKQEVHYGQL